MTEPPASGRTSRRLDRVAKPDPAHPIPGRDRSGKQALYSTAPGAPPSAQVLVRCRRCTVQSGLSLRGVVGLLRPPFLVDPVHGRLWARCPACRRRSCLEIFKGQALRALLDRPGR